MYIYIYIYIYTYIFEVVIESWPEWHLNPQPLNSVIPFRRSNRLSYLTMSSTHTQNQLCTATPILSLLQCQVSFRPLPSSFATFVLIEFFLR